MLSSFVQQSYYLRLPDELGQAFSIHSFQIEERLGRPYVIDLTLTSPLAEIPARNLLGSQASFVVTKSPVPLLPGATREWFGVIRSFRRLVRSADETRYQCRIAPRLEALARFTHSRLFQNQTVPEIIESILRKHEFSGDDFRLDLTGNYQSREYTTQYLETDFDFIRRLMEEEGLWFRFEQNEKDVVVFGDNLEHYSRNLSPVPFRPDSGLESVGLETIRSLSIKARQAYAAVDFKDYNYRNAGLDLMSPSQTGDDGGSCLEGRFYRWGSHHKDVEIGSTLATVHHERSFSVQVQASASGNVLNLAPGEVFTTDKPKAIAANGWLIEAVRHRGGRDSAYENSLSALPADRVYRLPLETRPPKIADSLPARVVSPGGYQYAYLDEMGRYRVRLPFDLDSWSPGGDSRPVRLGKPYAGPTYGQHFPLHEDTEVMLTFADGNPDRPYISGVMHDSRNDDHVPDTWNTRNVIRTWANNKLRLEDKSGQEHIKLATDYEKTQINLGHLVDGSREERGQGFELRTDGWGALRAGKGLFISADAQPGAGGRQLAMDEALAGLEGAVEAARALKAAAEKAESSPPDLSGLESAAEQLKELQEPGLLMSAPDGIAALTPANLILRSQGHSALDSAGDVMVKTNTKLIANAAGNLTALAHSGGLGLRVSSGPLKFQAQSTNIDAASRQDARLTSSKAKVAVEGSEAVTGTSGGGYITLKDGCIELGCPGEITFKCSSWVRQGPNEIKPDLPIMPIVGLSYDEQVQIIYEDTGEPVAYMEYYIEMNNGDVYCGKTNKLGLCPRCYTKEEEEFKLWIGREAKEKMENKA